MPLRRPRAQVQPQAPLSRRAFVDWTCLDGYNWGPRSPANPRPWRSFGELFRATYRRVVRGIARRKPMILAEIASSDFGGNKAGWIRNMLAKVPRATRRSGALVWFNVDDRNAGWPIERPRRVRRAFRRGINRSVYVTNQLRPHPRATRSGRRADAEHRVDFSSEVRVRPGDRDATPRRSGGRGPHRA